MHQIIEVYVRKIERLGQAAHSGTPIVAGYGAHWCTVHETYEVLSGMSEADQAAIVTASKVGEEKGLRIRVYDVDKIGSKIRARLKGVRSTPSIIFGDKKLEGNLARETILSIIQ